MEAEAGGEAVAAAWVAGAEGPGQGDRWVDGEVETEARDRTVRTVPLPILTPAQARPL